MLLKEARNGFLSNYECRHLTKGQFAIYKAAPGFWWNMGLSLLYDDKTKATNFLQLIAVLIVNYSVFETTSLVAAIFRSL